MIKQDFELRAVAGGGTCHPQRPLAFFFDFREIGHSSVQVSTELRRVGRCTGPLIDLSQSLPSI